MKFSLIILVSVFSLVTASCGAGAQPLVEETTGSNTVVPDESVAPTVAVVRPSATSKAVIVEELATPTPTIGVIEETITPTVELVDSGLPHTFRPVPITNLDLDPETPARQSVFLELLARVPDNEWTRKHVRITDAQTFFELAGGEPLPAGADGEARKQYLFDKITTKSDQVRLPSPIWPYKFEGYWRDIGAETFDVVGFDFGSAEQFIWAGQPPNVYEVAFGDYNLTAVETALASCECEQPETRQHAGAEYFAWGDGTGGLDRRLQIPLYDSLGRGARLLISDGEAIYSTKDGVIPELIDAAQGNIRSLADIEDFATAVELITSLGTFGKLLLVSDNFSIDEVVKWGAGGSSVGTSSDGLIFTEKTEQANRMAAEKGSLLKPFSFVMSGYGFDGQESFTGLVLAHGDEASAVANRDRLADRIQVGATNAFILNREYVDTYWSDIIRRVELVVEGRFLIARLYPVESRDVFIQGGSLEILTIHE